MSTAAYRPDVDGLRALAVLAVVVFHVDASLLPGGFLGVDIFFVISGYLISLILLREQAIGSFSFAGFYGRRIRRLFPALIVVLLTVIGFGFFALLANEYALLGRHSAAAIIFLLNIRLMSEAGYFDVASYSKPLLHLWSLSVEEQFYATWPVLLLVFRRIRGHVGWLVVGGAALSFAYALWLGSFGVDRLYYHPFGRFWELLVGAGVACWQQRDVRLRLPFAVRPGILLDGLSLVGLMLVCASLAVPGKHQGHPGVLTVLPVAGAAILIAAGENSLASRWLSGRLWVWIGLISYPLYLWHWPILSYLRIMESGHPARASLWAGALASVALAWATYRFVERPLRQHGNSRQVSWVLVLSMVLLFALSAALTAGGGWRSRPAVRHTEPFEAELIRRAAQDPSCIARFAGMPAPVYCLQFQPGPKMIALIGDSHAHVLFPGVSDLAAKEGVGTVLLANSGCPPLIGAVTGRNADERESCAKSIRVLLDNVLADSRIVGVVIASRGPQYLDGKGFGAVEAHYSYPPIAAQAALGGPIAEDPAAVFAGGLRNTVVRLHERGLHVGYLLQVPELGVPARDCLGRPLTLPGPGEGCAVALSVYAERMRNYRVQVQDVARAAAFLQVIDAQSLFCDANRCTGFMGGQLLYADDNHLSISGSRKIAPLIVQAALGRGPGK